MLVSQVKIYGRCWYLKENALLCSTYVCCIFSPVLSMSLSVCVFVCLLDQRDPRCMLITASHVKECVAESHGLLTANHSRAALGSSLSWLCDTAEKLVTIAEWGMLQRPPQPPLTLKRLKHSGFVRCTNWARSAEKSSDMCFVFVHSMIKPVQSVDDSQSGLYWGGFPLFVCSTWSVAVQIQEWLVLITCSNIKI